MPEIKPAPGVRLDDAQSALRDRPNPHTHTWHVSRGFYNRVSGWWTEHKTTGEIKGPFVWRGAALRWRVS